MFTLISNMKNTVQITIHKEIREQLKQLGYKSDSYSSLLGRMIKVYKEVIKNERGDI